MFQHIHTSVCRRKTPLGQPRITLRRSHINLPKTCSWNLKIVNFHSRSVVSLVHEGARLRPVARIHAAEASRLHTSASFCASCAEGFANSVLYSYSSPFLSPQDSSEMNGDSIPPRGFPRTKRGKVPGSGGGRPPRHGRQPKSLKECGEP